MIEVARVKAAREHLPNLHSEVMPAETLACANGSMDAVISRFALMLFGNVAVSARELARELRAGGTSAWPCGTDTTARSTARPPIIAEHVVPHFRKDYRPACRAIRRC
jgi:ubiquinone/menaquinone biosynthesis C-methylase UbiE